MDVNELWSTLVEKLKGWAYGAADMLPNVALAVVVAFIFVFVGKGVRAITDRGLRKTKMRVAARDLLVRIVHFAVLAAGLMVTLSILQLDKAVTSVLAGAGVIGLALGFAFQDLASNFISGVGLSVQHPFKRGDIIESNGVIGVVERIELRITTLRTFDGKRVLMPNSKVYQDVLTNHTDNDLKRLDLNCGVSYGDDLAKVKEVAIAALSTVAARDNSKDPEVYFTEFGDSSINFSARLWFDYNTQKDLTSCQDQMVMALKSAFDENDITIPFPIRTLDFGIKGGEPLTAMLGPQGISSSTRRDT